MPRNAAGTPAMSDQGAIQTASYSLGSPSRTAGQPAQAARALASVDYLAGDLYSNLRWTGFPPTTKLRMLQGRAEVRQMLAVAPGTSSQVVMDDLIRVAAALDAQDAAGVTAALPADVFTLGPARTVALLTNLPYLPAANIAAQNANAAITFGCFNSMSCG